MCLFNKPSRDFFCAEGGGRRYSWLSRLVDWGTQREVEPLRPREEPPHPELPVRPGEVGGGVLPQQGPWSRPLHAQPVHAGRPAGSSSPRV